MRKRIKQVSLISSILLLMLIFTSCNKLGKPTVILKGDKDEMYSLLDESIKDPNRPIEGILNSTITFTALIVSEPYDMDFDEEPGKVYKYQTAMIARNTNDVFMVNVTDTDKFKPGDLVSITGNVNGFIYNTVDNQKKEYLDIIAKSIEATQATDKTEGGSNIKKLKDGNMIIEEAFSVKSDKFEGITLYFEYENTKDRETIPLLGDMGRIYIDDYLLGRAPLVGNKTIKPDGDRLDITFNRVEPTYPNKKQKYVINLSPLDKEADVDVSKPLIFETYDDEYNLIEYYELPVTLVDEDGNKVE